MLPSQNCLTTVELHDEKANVGRNSHVVLNILDYLCFLLRFLLNKPRIP